MSFLQAYRDYCAQQTHAPSIFHEYIGLATIGAAMGARWKMPGFGGKWIYPNLWVLILAASSRFAKSTAVDLSRSLIQQVGSHDLTLAWRGSLEALTDQFSQRTGGVMYCKEFDQFIGMMKRDFMSGARGFWTDLYDGDLPAEVFLKRGNKRAKQDMAVSFVAASTIDWITDQMKESDIRGGLLPRFVIVPAYRSDREPKALPPTALDHTTPQKLAGELEKIAMSESIMTLSDAAQKEYRRWFSTVHNWQLDGTRADPWITRMEHTALKISMIIQADTDGGRVIGSEAMTDACRYAGWVLKEVGRICADELAFTKFESQVKRIRELLGKLDEGDWLPASELLKRSHLSSKEFEEVIKTCAATRQVESRMSKTTGRPGREFRLGSTLGE